MSACEIWSLQKKRNVGKRNGLDYNISAPTYYKIWIKMNSLIMPLEITEEKTYYYQITIITDRWNDINPCTIY